MGQRDPCCIPQSKSYKTGRCWAQIRNILWEYVMAHGSLRGLYGHSAVASRAGLAYSVINNTRHRSIHRLTDWYCELRHDELSTASDDSSTSADHKFRGSTLNRAARRASRGQSEGHWDKRALRYSAGGNALHVRQPFSRSFKGSSLRNNAFSPSEITAHFASLDYPLPQLAISKHNSEIWNIIQLMEWPAFRGTTCYFIVHVVVFYVLGRGIVRR